MSIASLSSGRTRHKNIDDEDIEAYDSKANSSYV